MTCMFVIVCYIEKKWYYTTNHLRKVNKPPLGTHESKGFDYVHINKIMLRCYPIKNMFMGIIGHPMPHHQFNGRIHIKRVSKTRYIQTYMAHKNVSDNI